MQVDDSGRKACRTKGLIHYFRFRRILNRRKITLSAARFECDNFVSGKFVSQRIEWNCDKRSESPLKMFQIAYALEWHRQKGLKSPRSELGQCIRDSLRDYSSASIKSGIISEGTARGQGDAPSRTAVHNPSRSLESTFPIRSSRF